MLSTQQKTIDSHLWISEAAYFLAEARGFELDKALDNWLDAEIAYSKMLITAYLATLEEDNEPITVFDLKQLAALIGVENSEKFISKAKLVQAIQKATKHRSCFQGEDHSYCQELECQWRSDCQKLSAVWSTE